MIPNESAVNSVSEMMPRIFSVVICGMLIIAGIISAPALGRGGPLPVTEWLDIWIGAIAVYSLLRTRIQTSLTLLGLIGYALTRIIPFALSGSPLYDFAQAYRWLFYLMVIGLVVGKRWGSVRGLIVMTWSLLILAILKGTLTLISLGVRPGLLLENNFEIPLFAGLVALLYGHLGRWRLPIIVTLAILTAVAGSRSGVLAFVVVAIFAVAQTKRANLFVRYLAFISLPAAGLVAYNIFAQRALNERRIDRLNFLDVFLAEASSWDVTTWLFGTMPITPLSMGGCQTLSAYSALYSTAGDGSCYSVILHAFFMRIVFDAGLLGLILSFALLWYFMSRSGVPAGLQVTLLLIAATNSVSVSGPNNPYVILPILLAVMGAHGASVQTIQPASVAGGYSRYSRLS